MFSHRSIEKTNSAMSKSCQMYENMASTINQNRRRGRQRADFLDVLDFTYSVLMWTRKRLIPNLETHFVSKI